MALKKLMFRATRGKALLHFFKIDPKDMIDDSRDLKEMLVFIVVFMDNEYLRDKINKICNASSNDPV